MKAKGIRKAAFRLWLVLSVPILAVSVLVAKDRGDIAANVMVAAIPVAILGGAIGGIAWIVSAFFED